MKRTLGVAGAALAMALLAGCGALPPAGVATDGAAAAPQSNAAARARIHTELAAGYLARGQFSVALASVNQALGADPGFAPAHSILGLIRAELREDAQAEQALRRAIALQPSFSEAHNNLGHFLCQKGRTEEGLRHLEEALKNPLYATPEKALTNAGQCSLRRGDVAAAERHFQRALRHAANLPLALQGMAEVDFRQGRYLASRVKLQRLGDLGELSAQALWLGIRTERMLGDKAAELAYATQLRRRFPEAMETQWLIMGQYDQFGAH